MVLSTQTCPPTAPTDLPALCQLPSNSALLREETHRADLTGPMLTLKAFLDLQSADVDLTEAKKAYFQYREEYERRFTETFYSEHQAEPWFLEKYDPRLVQEFTHFRIQSAQFLHKEFLSALQSQAFAGLLLRDCTEVTSGPPAFAFDSASLTLFLGLLPLCVWRKELICALHAVPGFTGLSLSEAQPSKGFCRFAWAKFDTEKHCEEACKLLTQVQVNAQCSIAPSPCQPNVRKAPKTQPPQSLPSLIADWKHLTALITHLDRLHSIPENPLLVSETQFVALEDQEKQVDLQLLYLRRVHGVCYYCAEVCEDERELAAKCGPVHFRSKVIGTQESKGSLTEKRLEDVYKKTKLAVYDSRNDKKLADLIGELCANLAILETAPKVRCSNCKKLFFDQKFLRKHIESKHIDLIEGVKKTHYDKMTMERFQQDPGKFNYMQIERNTVKRQREDSFEDLDDPGKRPKTRKVVNYSDI